MNYIIWNCNGAYSKRFLGTLKDVVNTHKPILIGLLETKCSGEHADKIFNSLRFNYWCRVEAIGLNGGIWLLWKKCIDPTILKTHSQFIHVKISTKYCRTWFLSVVYGSPNITISGNFYGGI